MKTLYLMFLFIPFLFISQSAKGQSHTLSGLVTDSSYLPLEAVQVAITDSIGNIKAALLTDEKGFFKISTNLVRPTVVMTQFNVILFKKTIQLNGDTSLGNIAVSNGKTLNEITITGRKNIIERKIDRLVYNVENSIASKGGTTVDLLRNTPLLRIDNSSISIVGKSGMSIMINDRPLRLDGEDLLNYLKSIASDDVSKIEVITTPPARYGAQGNSGIINIVLKKNPAVGLNGSFSPSFTQTTYLGYANSANLNWADKKVTLSLKLRQYNRQQKVSENINLLGDSAIYSNTSRKDRTKGLGANLNFNINLNTSAQIGLVYDFANTNNLITVDNTTTYLYAGRIDSTLRTPADQSNGNITHTLSGYYNLKLDNKGKTLNIEIDYFGNKPIRENIFSTYFNSTISPEIVKNTSNLNYKVYSGQANVDLPSQIISSSFGIKYSLFENNSDIKYYNFINNNYVNDASRSNLFGYKERNAAAYLTLKKEFSKKISAQVGLRYEYATVEGISKNDNSSNSYNYGNLFPTAYLQYKPNEKNHFNINYSKRINRPGFNALNPFRWYSNPYIYSAGNPFLRPSFNHNLEINYTLNNKLNITAYYQKTLNGFGGLTQVSDGVKITTFQNYFETANSGISASYTLSLTKGWENHLSGVIYQSQSTSSVPSVVPINGVSAFLSSNNNFVLNQNKTTFLSINLFYNFPSRELNVYSKGLYDVSLGLRKILIEKKLSLSISAQDIFKGSVSRAELKYASFKQVSENYYDNRRLIVSATYNFGKSTIKGANKQLKFSDKSRAN